jgi:tetraacyldisaccharide 4'-kinase
LLSLFLENQVKTAVLSRGYGRASKGFYEVTDSDNASQFGDEPCQIKGKFADVPVFVSENRCAAVPKILTRYPNLEVLVLDDAFQHRKIHRNKNILLTRYDKPFYTDYLFPVGFLREYRSGAKRADLVVVTKSPAVLDAANREKITAEIQHYAGHIPVLFSSIAYAPVRAVLGSNSNLSNICVLLTSIADNSQLLDYLSGLIKTVIPYSLQDHAVYNTERIDKIIAFCQSKGASTILTTAKDVVKLRPFLDKFERSGISLYVQDIEHRFLSPSDKALFDTFVLA